jgi:hypothetical protein
MNTSTIHARHSARRNSPSPAEVAATREARRLRDLERLEAGWARLCSPQPAIRYRSRCSRCAPLPQGMRCAACVLTAMLPGLRT